MRRADQYQYRECIQAREAKTKKGRKEEEKRKASAASELRNIVRSSLFCVFLLLLQERCLFSNFNS